MENLARTEQKAAEANNETRENLLQCRHENRNDNFSGVTIAKNGGFEDFVATRLANKLTGDTTTDLWDRGFLYSDEFKNGKHNLSKSTGEAAARNTDPVNFTNIKENSTEFKSIITKMQTLDFDNLPDCSKMWGDGYSKERVDDDKIQKEKPPLVSLREVEDLQKPHNVGNAQPAMFDWIYKNGQQIAWRSLFTDQGTRFGVEQNGKLYWDSIDNKGKDHVQVKLHGKASANEMLSVPKGSREYNQVLKTIRAIDWDHIPTANWKPQFQKSTAI